jgi:hypothetical protein
LVYVSERKIAIFVNVISVLMAAVLLFVAIYTLHAVKSPNKKLIMIGAYMLLFAITIGLLTTAKRSEIWAATAAYVLIEKARTVLC